MTKNELEVARFLYITARSANDLAEARKRLTAEIITNLDVIQARAAESFLQLTGRTIWNVHSLTELSADNPAEWTKMPMLDGRR